MRKPGMSSDGAPVEDARASSTETVPAAVVDQPHDVELSVRRELLAEPGLRFSSLVVRRVPDGVCLEGVMEVKDDEAASDIGSLVKRVAGVQNVLNHLVTHAPPSPPPKG